LARVAGDVQELARVAICGGKDCRKQSECAQLQTSLQTVCEVRVVTCLGICKGPVAVVQSDSADPIVLRKLRKPKLLRDLMKMLIDGESMSKRLRRRMVRGRKRRSAIAKVSRTQPRGPA
jgi:hypothetical protein